MNIAHIVTSPLVAATLAAAAIAVPAAPTYRASRPESHRMANSGEFFKNPAPVHIEIPYDGHLRVSPWQCEIVELARGTFGVSRCVAWRLEVNERTYRSTESCRLGVTIDGDFNCLVRR